MEENNHSLLEPFNREMTKEPHKQEQGGEVCTSSHNIERNGDTCRDDYDYHYGCSCFKPKSLQFINSIRWHVLWQCLFNFFEGFVVNGVINVIIPALEKRYELSSSRSGLIASGNDIGALVVLIFVGYFGEQRHKPRLMATGILIMSVGCLVFALPHFIGENYSFTVSGQSQNISQNICAENNTKATSCDANENENNAKTNTGYYAMFIIGQILLGIGAAPMFTIGLTYIDENCKAKMTSFHISMTFCFAAIGVAIGFIVGGQTLSLFVDVEKVKSGSVPLTPDDPQWVGAWWIGILIALVGLLISAIPISGYPKRLPGYEQLKRTRKSEAHDDGTEEIVAQASFGKGWKDLPKMLVLLLKNPTFVLLCLGGTTDYLIVGGLATFGSKLIQQFHNVDLITAGAIMGFVSIPGSGGGMLLGGYIVKRFKLKCRGIIRLCSGCAIICMLFAPSFLVFCSDGPIAGVSVGYLSDSSDGLIAQCNSGCGCSTQGYEPVCDNHQITYFSPCHAGCKQIHVQNDTKSFLDCSCINTTMNINQSDSTVSSGSCSEQCNLLYVFCVLLTLMMLFTFTIMSPTATACFRCVPHKQRSFAIAVQLIVLRSLGTFPGPIILGSIIDRACDVWQETQCGGTGSCWIYRKFDLGIYLMCWWIGMKSLGCILYFTASKVYKAPEEKDKDLNDINKLPSISLESSQTSREITNTTKL